MIVRNYTEPRLRTNEPECIPWHGIGWTAQGIRESLEDHWCMLGAGDPDGSWVLGCVFDGVGGIPDGEDASQAAADSVCAFITQSIRDYVDDEQLLIDALAKANSGVEQLEGPATTAVLALTRSDGWITVAWVGDSRAYLVDETGVLQLTTDHSTFHTDSLGFARPSLSRWLGSSEHGEPEVIRFKATPGSMVLLTTDGVHDVIDDAELGELANGQLNTACLSIVEESLTRGSTDNCTCVALQQLRQQPVSTDTAATTTPTPSISGTPTRSILRVLV